MQDADHETPLENSPPAWLAAATTGSVIRRAKHAGSQTPREHKVQSRLCGPERVSQRPLRLCGE